MFKFLIFIILTIILTLKLQYIKNYKKDDLIKFTHQVKQSFKENKLIFFLIIIVNLYLFVFDKIQLILLDSIKFIFSITIFTQLLERKIYDDKKYISRLYNKKYKKFIKKLKQSLTDILEVENEKLSKMTKEELLGLIESIDITKKVKVFNLHNGFIKSENIYICDYFYYKKEELKENINDLEHLANFLNKKCDLYRLVSIKQVFSSEILNIKISSMEIFSKYIEKKDISEAENTFLKHSYLVHSEPIIDILKSIIIYLNNEKV